MPDLYVTQAIQELLEIIRVWDHQKDLKNEEYTREGVRQMTNKEENVQRSESLPKTPFASYHATVIQFEDLQIDEKKRIGHGGFGNIFATK